MTARFSPRPISAAGYRAIARRLRYAADKIEQLATRTDPHGKQARSKVLGSAYSFVRAAFRRNAGLPLHDPIEWSADDD